MKYGNVKSIRLIRIRYQSHHTGIEMAPVIGEWSINKPTNRTILELKFARVGEYSNARANYQSHHTGIEIHAQHLGKTNQLSYQSHHTGIEIGHRNAINRL